MLSMLFSRVKNSIFSSDMIEEGDRIPDFTILNQSGEKISSDEISSAVIFFFPRAMTPGCTKEVCEFRDSLEDFEELGYDVYGVSTDSPDNQEAFHESEELNFELLSDEGGKLSSKFGVLGRAGMAKRTSFVVDNGKVQKVFTDVNPEDHVEEVLEFLRFH